MKRFLNDFLGRTFSRAANDLSELRVALRARRSQCPATLGSLTLIAFSSKKESKTATDARRVWRSSSSGSRARKPAIQRGYIILALRRLQSVFIFRIRVYPFESVSSFILFPKIQNLKTFKYIKFF